MRFSERGRPRPRRQEDYEDYTERNIDEGWPYGDEPGRRERRLGSGPYGEALDFGRERNPGMHNTDEAVAGSAAPPDADWQDRRRHGDDVFGPRPRARRPDHRGKGPRGYTRSDERIREDVCDLLTEDAQLDPSDVEVTVSGGEVTLDGYVSERSEKRMAEDWAEQVGGVIHVQNNLRIGQREE
ncbi:MAG TPA: BON domain-containing protein [Pararhizobium sp.]|nr:BON domain-containing protein [Pararhizobium sp.]